MKTAVTSHGEPVLAGPDAPESALCPYCGGPLRLRQRRTMDNHLTYFWRHQDNHHLHCQKRSTPIPKTDSRGKTNNA